MSMTVQFHYTGLGEGNGMTVPEVSQTLIHPSITDRPHRESARKIAELTGRFGRRPWQRELGWCRQG